MRSVLGFGFVTVLSHTWALSFVSVSDAGAPLQRAECAEWLCVRCGQIVGSTQRSNQSLQSKQPLNAQRCKHAIVACVCIRESMACFPAVNESVPIAIEHQLFATITGT